MPISLSAPWGLSIGAVGLLPYLPLPAKLETRLLPAVRPASDQTATDLAEHVHYLMQQAMDELTAGRRWLRGRPKPSLPPDDVEGRSRTSPIASERP